MPEPDDRPTPAAQPTDVIVAAVVAWIEGVADLHREVASACEELRALSLPIPVDERLSELVVLLRQRQAQAPTRTAVETWVRSIAGGAGPAPADSSPAR